MVHTPIKRLIDKYISVTEKGNSPVPENTFIMLDLGAVKVASPVMGSSPLPVPIEFHRAGQKESIVWKLLAPPDLTTSP